MESKQLFDKMLKENDECTSTEMMKEFAKIHLKAIIEEVFNSINENPEKMLICNICCTGSEILIDKQSIDEVLTNYLNKLK